ncbi:hypothetical protein FSP39_022473 [Pinctada imbricata]|uniref:PrdX deacylase domain-containing protein 1 n=1 Tax=Pinctada imbricata TaxID=66713 RepID=A0AA89BVJ3_PINIB|nr:hypothetical protein FSP39_022473 [Pinctada imbricata]
MDTNVLKAYARALQCLQPGHSLFTAYHQLLWCPGPGSRYRPHHLLGLFGILRHLDITTETVTYHEKGRRNDVIETVYCKNLFLKDRKGTFYIIVCHEDTKVNLKFLKTKLNAHRNFSFATQDDLFKVLNLDGFVTPFCLMFPSTEHVKIVCM